MTSVGQLLVGFPEPLCEDKVMSFSVSLASLCYERTPSSESCCENPMTGGVTRPTQSASLTEVYKHMVIPFLFPNLRALERRG